MSARRLLQLVGGWLALVAGPARGDEGVYNLPEAPRFRGRLQVLSGVGLALPQDAAGNRSPGAYVPLDVEIAMRVAGPIGLGLGAAGYLAPFESSACPAPTRQAQRRGRPTALASYLDARFDLNNSRDGSWLSPWLGLRMGVVGQDGLADYGPAGTSGTTPLCTERIVLAPFLSPRAGLDLWLGPAAVTFALGYELLPRAPALSAEIGLTVRLF